jgi:hypothetical protein
MLYAYPLDSDVSCCIHALDLQTIKACFIYVYPLDSHVKPASFMRILWVVVFVVLYMFFDPGAIRAQSVYAYPLGSGVCCSTQVLTRKPLGPNLFMHILWVVMCIVLYMFLTRKPLGPRMLYAYPLDSDVSCSIHAFDPQNIKACFICV